MELSGAPAAAGRAGRRWRGGAAAGAQVQFTFPEPTELTPPLMQLNDVSFKYPQREDFGLSQLDIGIVSPPNLFPRPIRNVDVPLFPPPARQSPLRSAR